MSHESQLTPLAGSTVISVIVLSNVLHFNFCALLIPEKNLDLVPCVLTYQICNFAVNPAINTEHKETVIIDEIKCTDVKILYAIITEILIEAGAIFFNL